MSFYRTLIKKKKLSSTRAPKYGNRRTELDGRSFASKGEANLYLFLKRLEADGKIKDIRCQVTVRLSAAKIIYMPDFVYFDLRTNETIYAELKGFETASWRIKRKLWLEYGPGPLMVYNCKGEQLILKEELFPQLSKEPSSA